MFPNNIELDRGVVTHHLLQNIDPGENLFNDLYRNLCISEVSPYYNIDNYNGTLEVILTV